MNFSPETIAFREMLKKGEYLILDTETTGIGYKDEICEIAIINADGEPLLNTLVKPLGTIPVAAISIHGITNTHVANAASWQTVWQQVATVITGKDIVVYNADFDRKLMYQSSKAWNMPQPDWKALQATFWCCMEAFSEIFGDWNPYHQDYRWQKLETAVRYYRSEPFGAHRALGDCLDTRLVCRGIVEDKGKHFVGESA